MNKRQKKKSIKEFSKKRILRLLGQYVYRCEILSKELEELKAKLNKPKTTRKKKVEGVKEGD